MSQSATSASNDTTEGAEHTPQIMNTATALVAQNQLDGPYGEFEYTPEAGVSKLPADLATGLSDPITPQLPVVEIFGPTVQGEGPLIGVHTMFVRLGYCDYRCIWCDSMHAVIPRLVRENSTKMTSAQIVLQLNSLSRPTNTRWVTISGGNPAIHAAVEILIMLLHSNGYKVAIETQGSINARWLYLVDCVIISPKPPSSRMAPDFSVLRQLISNLNKNQYPRQPERYPTHAIKVVVFDRKDYDWAREVHAMFIGVPFYLSVGNAYTPERPPRTHYDHLADLTASLAEITEWTLQDRDMSDVITLPQMHVLMWGNRPGV